jgi:uncharacterized zinc-type alcohol dehydrogenase-like protein
MQGSLEFRNTDNWTEAPIPAPQDDEYVDAVWGINKLGENFSPFTINIPKPSGHLVQIEGAYSGVCHTDVHVGLNHLGGAMYPLVPGHELVGKVVAVGELVTRFKVGEYAGIAALTDSCLECDSCKAGDEQYCEVAGWHQTYNQKKIYGHYGGN